MYTFLEPGQDCSQSNAIIALAQTIEEQNKLPERYNKDRYTCTYDSNSLTVSHLLYGKKFNNIICLSNITQETKSPYIIMESANLVNMKDFLTRIKNIAKWDNPTFVEGEDPDIESCIKALKDAIEINQKDEVILTYLKKDNGIDDTTGFDIEYKIIGEKGNIVLNSDCVNVKLSAKRLQGGLDGLKENEDLYINCEREEIISSENRDRYKNLTNKDSWLEIPLDGVALRVKKGYFKIAFRYRETYYI